MLRPCGRRHHAILPATGTARSPRDCAPPIPAWSQAGHRFQQDSCFVTIVLCQDAAASRVGINCCSLPCQLLAAPVTWSVFFCHFERSEESLRFLLATRHSSLATEYPALRRKWA